MRSPIWPEYRKFLANHSVEGVLLMQQIDASIVVSVALADPAKKARPDVALRLLATGEEPPEDTPR